MNTRVMKSSKSKAKLESVKAGKCPSVHGGQFLFLSVYSGDFKSMDNVSKCKADTHKLEQKGRRGAAQ